MMDLERTIWKNHEKMVEAADALSTVILMFAGLIVIFTIIGYLPAIYIVSGLLFFIGTMMKISRSKYDRIQYERNVGQTKQSKED